MAFVRPPRNGPIGRQRISVSDPASRARGVDCATGDGADASHAAPARPANTANVLLVPGIWIPMNARGGRRAGVASYHRTTPAGVLPSNAPMLAGLAQDLSYAVRTLGRSRGFTIVALSTLALGIGATSAIFGFVDGALLKPLPYPGADRIPQVWETPPGGGNNVVSTANFLDWQRDGAVFETLVATTGGQMTLTGQGDPRLLRVGRVSAGYFDVFGIKPAIGRTFAHDEDIPGRDHVVVLSHQLWTTQFGGEASIVGRTITLNGQQYTVIGVMPEGSAFDRGFNRMWRPLAFAPNERARNFHWLQVLGRLKPAVMLEQAR